MKKNRILLLSITLLALFSFLVLPALSASSYMMNPYDHWADAGWGIKPSVSMSYYRYNDQNIAVWTSEWDQTLYRCYPVVQTRAYALSIGLPLDELRIYYDFVGCSKDIFGRWIWVSFQYDVAVYDQNDNAWQFFKVGTASAPVTGYYSIDDDTFAGDDVDDFYYQSGNYFYVEIRIRVYGQYSPWVHVDQENAQWIW